MKKARLYYTRDNIGYALFSAKPILSKTDGWITKESAAIMASPPNSPLMYRPKPKLGRMVVFEEVRRK